MPLILTRKPLEVTRIKLGYDASGNDLGWAEVDVIESHKGRVKLRINAPRAALVLRDGQSEAHK